MPWIKKNPIQFAAALVAVIAIGLSIWMVLSANAFQEQFTFLSEVPPAKNKIDKQELTAVNEAVSNLGSPKTWQPSPDTASLFVSRYYILKPDFSGLVNPLKDGAPLHPPIPNLEIIEAGLDLLDPNIRSLDSDGDGFTNLEEWEYAHSNGSKWAPLDPKISPPYWLKLELVDVKRIPFRMQFMAYDGDVRKLAEMNFQVNALDAGRKTSFLKIGQEVPNTRGRYVLERFEEKLEKQGDIEKDVSTLFVRDTEYDQEIPLVLRKLTDSPDSYAVLAYNWVGGDGKKTTNQGVKRNLSTTPLPPTGEKLKLVDIKDTEAVFQLPSGKKLRLKKSSSGTPPVPELID
jgi:hypothetical protein